MIATIVESKWTLLKYNIMVITKLQCLLYYYYYVLIIIVK